MKTVLVVDDEPDIVALISMVLADGEIRLLTAYDGQEALELAREEHPDLVLTDVMMPRLDGRQLCLEVKADPANDNTKVVLMSAIRTLEAESCRADALIRKPFDIWQLAETVKLLLAGTE